MKTIRFNSCMECPCRKSVLDKGDITVLCDRLSKNLTNMDWTPDKLDEMTFSLLQFPRDCPIENDPIEEEPELCPPEPDPKKVIGMFQKRSRELVEEGKHADAAKLFQEASKIQFELMLAKNKEAEA